MGGGGRSPSCRTLQHPPETRSATYLPGEPSPGGRFPQHTDNSSLPGKRLLSLAPVRAARVPRAPPSRKRNLMFNFSPNLPISSSEGAKTGATSTSLGPHLTTSKTPAGGRAKHWRAKGRGRQGARRGVAGEHLRGGSSPSRGDRRRDAPAEPRAVVAGRETPSGPRAQPGVPGAGFPCCLHVRGRRGDGARLCTPPTPSDNSHGDKMAAQRPAVVPQASRAPAAAPAPQ